MFQLDQMDFRQTKNLYAHELCLLIEMQRRIQTIFLHLFRVKIPQNNKS